MRTVLVLVLGAAALVGCGSEAGSGSGGPTVVVTTSILGDVVEHLVGEQADVEVLMPAGADPHDFAPSARQAAAMREADLLVVNGLGFEAGLVDTIEAAEADGTTVVTATDAIDPQPIQGEAEVMDPHLFTDPVRLRRAAAAIADALGRLALDDPTAFRAQADGYLEELEALDAEVAALVEGIPPEDRLLVTNHDVFGYFADRYGFEILGAVIPGGSTLAEPSAADLADLAALIEERGVPAVFADTSSPSRLADALAAEGADVEVVELYSESLGEEGSPGDTYVGMIRTNAERIAAALA